MATLPAPRPELQAPPMNPSFGGTMNPPQLSGRYGGWLSDLSEAKKLYPDLFKGDFGSLLAFNMMQQGKSDDPNALREQLNILGDFREKEAQRAQQLGAQSTVFGGVVKSLLDLGNVPRRMAAARQMYGPETISGFRLPVEALERQQPRYF